MIFKRSSVQQSEDENSFWISYSDILSSLLIIILLITVYAVFELMNTKKNVTESLDEITKAELVRKDVLVDIKEYLESEGVEVEIADNYSVLRIPESTLTFKTNDYSIPENLKDELSFIGNAILDALIKDDRSLYFDTIFIEGHTDIRPSNRLMGNLGLSTFRAISVWNFWKDEVSNRYQMLENSNGDKLFSFGGYGETRPATKVQVSEEDFRKNRRIDIRFTIRKPTSVDYTDILTIFNEN